MKRLPMMMAICRARGVNRKCPAAHADYVVEQSPRIPTGDENGEPSGTDHP